MLPVKLRSALSTNSESRMRIARKTKKLFFRVKKFLMCAASAEMCVVARRRGVVPGRVGRVHIYMQAGLLRSEEQPFELQSLMRISYAVVCLQKKTNRNILHKITLAS